MLGFGNCFLMPHETLYKEPGSPTGLCGTVLPPARSGCCHLTAARVLWSKSWVSARFRGDPIFISQMMGCVDAKAQFCSCPGQRGQPRVQPRARYISCFPRPPPDVVVHR